MKLAEKLLKVNEDREGDIEFIADQLVNDDTSSDEEMIEFIVDETGFDKAKVSKIIKIERPKFLKDIKLQMLPTKDLVSIVKKYL